MTTDADALVIRDATEDDLPDILAIHNHHIANTVAIWRYEQESLDDRRTWWRGRVDNGFPVVVADIDGAVVGYGGYGPFRVGVGYDRTVENSIYVRDDHQRKGIARRLMRDLTQRAKAQGRHVMVAGIGLPNDASVAMHASLGFVDCGVVREIGWKFDRWLDLRFMQKIL